MARQGMKNTLNPFKGYKDPAMAPARAADHQSIDSIDHM